jgi:hypothetical protein
MIVSTIFDVNGDSPLLQLSSNRRSGRGTARQRTHVSDLDDVDSVHYTTGTGDNRIPCHPSLEPPTIGNAAVHVHRAREELRKLA